jgi:SAM-dependent methyltransferase
VASGGYDPELFETIAAVEDESFWFQARNRLIVSTLTRFFPDARSLLEVGCGTGVVLAALHDAFPKLRLAGLEPAAEGFAIARRRLPEQVELVRQDVFELAAEAEYDVVGAFDVLEHVREDERVLAAMAHALRSGGGLMLLVPQHPRLWSPADTMAGHVRRYTRGDLAAKTRAAGFEVLATTGFVSSLLPAAALARAVRRSPDPTAELKPPLVNGLFERLLDAERRLVERGISLPFGLSLLLVARKP